MNPARVMIVEDDRVVARDIRTQVSRMGHSVVGVTGSGEEAVTLAAAEQPDLVLMDIRLEGEMDGIEAAQRIRSKNRIPVVFLTAYGNEEIIRRASLTEPFGYLLKPFEEPQMRTVIQMALYKREAESRVRLGEKRYAATLASIADGVISTDEEGRIDFINPAAERLTGWLSDEAIGRRLGDIFIVVDEETRVPLESPATRLLASGGSALTGNRAVLIARGGSEVLIEERCSPVENEGAIAGTVLVFTDYTQKRAVAEALEKAHNDLAHVARLTLMGELAAAIAHEDNTPLMAMVTNAGTCLQWLERERPDIDRARTAVERVIRDGHRAGEVVRSIHALAKRSPSARALLDLNVVTQETLSLIRGELRRAEVKVLTELAKQLPVVLGDRVQIQQVLLNLIVNAIESMLPREPKDRLLTIVSGCDDDMVRVDVIDSGTGVDEAIRDRIFEALFTTKTNGLGMGLSISRSIAELHGGSLSMTSWQSGGSEFRIMLPAERGSGS
jgi:two-component system, cell cycle sensor histidine kinase and response regulator CckA